MRSIPGIWAGPGARERRTYRGTQTLRLSTVVAEILGVPARPLTVDLHHHLLLTCSLPVLFVPSTTPVREGRTDLRERPRLATSEFPLHPCPPDKLDKTWRASNTPTSRRPPGAPCCPANKRFPKRSG